MTKEQVFEMLPVIIAFAKGMPVQWRRDEPGALTQSWVTINPETTEFRLTEFSLKPSCWRVLDDPATILMEGESLAELATSTSAKWEPPGQNHDPARLEDARDSYAAGFMRGFNECAARKERALNGRDQRPGDQNA